jgi:hypothetical protein
MMGGSTFPNPTKHATPNPHPANAPKPECNTGMQYKGTKTIQLFARLARQTAPPSPQNYAGVYTGGGRPNMSYRSGPSISG